MVLINFIILNLCGKSNHMPLTVSSGPIVYKKVGFFSDNISGVMFN